MANVVGIAAEHLQQIVSRIERLEEEKKGIADDIKEVYAEAKSNGFDVKILRQVIKLRKMDKAALEEQDALLEIYRDALDMTAESSASLADDAEMDAHDAPPSPSPAAPRVGRPAIQPAASGSGGLDLLAQATIFCRTKTKVSLNDVQKQFRLNYVRAHDLMDRLHHAGVVGASKGNSRKVLPFEGEGKGAIDPRLRKALKKMVANGTTIDVTTAKGTVRLSQDLLGEVHGERIGRPPAAGDGDAAAGAAGE